MFQALLLAVAILIPIGWIAGEISNRVWLRRIAGVGTIGMAAVVAALFGQLSQFNYNAWYGAASKELVSESVIQMESGNQESVLEAWKVLNQSFAPSYETRAEYDKIVRAAVASMRTGQHRPQVDSSKADRELEKQVESDAELRALEIPLKCSPTAIRGLKRCARLERVDLSGTGWMLKDVGCRSLYVPVEQEKVGSEHADFIRYGDQELFLFKPDVDDAVVEALSELGTLKEIVLWYGRFTAKQKRMLNAKLPQCRIVENANKL